MPTPGPAGWWKTRALCLFPRDLISGIREERELFMGLIVVRKMRAVINVYSSLPDQDWAKPTVQRDST